MVLRKIENKSFIRSSEGTVASYNWTDVVSGRGMLTLYGADSIKGNYYLSNYQTYAATGKITNGSALDLDFDVIINQNITFQGNAILTIPTYTDGGSGVVTNVSVKIRKYSGGIETDLATDSYNTTVGDKPWKLFTFILTITKTLFKVGDILRLTVEVPARPVDTKSTHVFCDPMSLQVTSEIKATQLKLNMPVVIDR